MPEALHYAEHARDHDLDDVPDAKDNCPHDPNPDQRDTNGDGLGNLCDPDFDDDGLVETSWGAISRPYRSRSGMDRTTKIRTSTATDVSTRATSCAPSSGCFERRGAEAV